VSISFADVKHGRPIYDFLRTDYPQTSHCSSYLSQNIVLFPAASPRDFELAPVMELSQIAAPLLSIFQFKLITSIPLFITESFLVFLLTRRRLFYFFSVLAKVNAADVESNMTMFVRLSLLNVSNLVPGKPAGFYFQEHGISWNLQSFLAQ
jgi:hypothetical protein